MSVDIKTTTTRELKSHDKTELTQAIGREVFEILMGDGTIDKLEVDMTGMTPTGTWYTARIEIGGVWVADEVAA